MVFETQRLGIAKSGEILLRVRSEDAWKGVGGVNQDPYVKNESIGRLRHLYVMPGYRRNGIGAALVVELTRRAKNHFRELRLRTHESAASEFYISQGFKYVSDGLSFTHRRWFGLVNDGT